MAVEPAFTQPIPSRPGEAVQLAPAPPPLDDAHDQRRWGFLLSLELAAFAILLALLFGTGVVWFIVPAFLAAPIAVPLTLVYLAMSTDTNVAALNRTNRTTKDHTGGREPRSDADPSQPITERSGPMSSRFITNLLVLVGAGFVAGASQAFSSSTTRWIAFAVALGVLGMTAAAQVDYGRGYAQRALDAMIGALAVWSAIASMVFDGSTLTWLSLGDALGLAILAIGGLAAHELSTERVVHSLAAGESTGERAVKAAEPYSTAA
jgi:hypothetical protein